MQEQLVAIQVAVWPKAGTRLKDSDLVTNQSVQIAADDDDDGEKTNDEKLVRNSVELRAKCR